MGLIQEVKKEWTWTNIKQSWPELISIGPAVFFADEFRDKGFLVWAGVWAVTFIVSDIILRFIGRIIKKNK